MNFLLITTVCFAVVTVVNAARPAAPSITSPGGNKWSQTVIYVRVPNPTSVECSATGNPTPKFYWTNNGTRIVPNRDVLYFDEDTGLLTTGKYFTGAHSGDFQCFAHNSVGTSMTPILKLYAAIDAAFEGGLIKGNKTVAVSKYVALRCEGAPYSLPQWSFKWTRGTSYTDKDSFQDLQKDKRLMVDEEGTLHFLWTESSDAGYYSCKTTNDIFLSSYRSTRVIKLDVLIGKKDDRGPEFKFAQDVQVYAGENAKLMCIFSYYSSRSENLQVTWLHLGKTVGYGPNITLVNVKLPNATQNQTGQYRCQAKIGTKEAFHDVNLKIVSPPTFLRGGELQSNYVPVEADAVFRCNTTSYQTYSFPPVWFVNGKPLLGCPQRYFECKETLPDGFSNCIPEKNEMGKHIACNNYPDCQDETDEQQCIALTCIESQKQCRDKCVPEAELCLDLQYNYPDFLCYDGLSFVTADKLCNGIGECLDGSDELACWNGYPIQRGRFLISPDMTELIVPNVRLTDTMCFQCMVTNEYGTTVGDACMSVIDQIVVVKGPESAYNVEPNTTIAITIEAHTDELYDKQMTYTWRWYQDVIDKKTGEKTTVASELPPEGQRTSNSFIETNGGRNMKIIFPPVEDDKKAFEIYHELINRNYTVIISHLYDRVEVNFTVNGKVIVEPVPVIKKATTNLWFIAIIVGVLLLFLVVVLIVCYMYRNRGGTYPLDKKEHKAGYDPEQELKEGGLQDVGRVGDEDYGDPAEKVSLSESVKPYESDDDPTEEYGGDFEGTKFNEDGSFIGAYGSKTKEATV